MQNSKLETRTPNPLRLLHFEFCLLNFALLSLSACSPGYVLRAAYEELRILARRQPIEELLAGELDPDVRAKLELTLAVREFARDRLELRVGGSYASLAETDARQVVHLVSAARRDRLEAHTWWFPVVGRVPYRGYFDRAGAEALAADLEGKGYDTYVRPAVAFSTLGWFDDPLLSSLLRHDEVALAEIIIHELLHNTIYVAGQAGFNESLASFVGYAGAAAFFEERGDMVRAEHARALWADEVLFSRFLDDFVTELSQAYARGINLEERARLFAAAQRRCAAEPWRTGRYADFPRQQLNNAKILHYQLYAHRLAVFDQVHARFGGDLTAAIGWIRAVVASGGDPFAALEEQLSAVVSSASLGRHPGRRSKPRRRTKQLLRLVIEPAFAAAGAKVEPPQACAWAELPARA
jgi:predicted aminopeptidase